MTNSKNLRPEQSCEIDAPEVSENSQHGSAVVPSAAEAFHNLNRLYARPGFLLRRAHQISASVFEDACRDVELTPAQYGAMTVLHARPGLDQSSLARALGFDKVTVLRVLRVLESRHLVQRSPALDNRRSLHLALTDIGRALLGEALPLAERAYQRLVSPLSQKQRSQLTELLQLMTQGLEPDARAPLVRAGAAVAIAGEHP